MARTRVTIRRIDPWSILKFGFVANLVLLGIQLLAGAVIWYVIQRLQLIQTVCDLAGTVGFEECGVDGGALFDTVLVLGLLGVVIQTGILVFLAFLANLIFDLTGGIGLTLEDDRRPASGGRGSTSRTTPARTAPTAPTAPSASAGTDSTQQIPTTGALRGGSPQGATSAGQDKDDDLFGG